MSHYVAAGITDEDLIFKSEEAREASAPSSGGTTITDLFNLMTKLGLDFEAALGSPVFLAAMRAVGVKVAQLRAEKERREQKNKLLLWGGIAVGVAFLALRKK